MKTKQHERSKSFRKVMKRSPGGNLTLYAKRRKKKEKNRCEICSTPIKVFSKKTKALPKVCNACVSRISLLKARVAEGASLTTVDLRYIPYLKRI